MEEVHRNIIQTKYATLVKECDINTLLPLLVKKNVFSKEMIKKYTNKLDNLGNKRKLFIDIQMRGPHAFRKLVAALCETNQTGMANLLDPYNTPAPIQPKKCAVPFMLPTNTETTVYQTLHNISTYPNVDFINLSTESTKIVVKGSTKLYDDPTRNAVPIYSTHSKKRGIALIINIINYDNQMHATRRGADIDGRYLNDLFLQMGLQVVNYEDVTCEEIKEAILQFKQLPGINRVDMVFVVIMGHGLYAGEGCLIIGSDNQFISTIWIEEQFDNVHCKALQNRPKIMIYQTCRGNIPDYGVGQQIETDSARPMRTRTDMLIAHSTLPGNVSHRDKYLGTWYIQKFCEIMMNHAHDTHLEDIFKMVDVSLSRLKSEKETMQTSTYTNQGFKICYVHPKIYSDEGIIKDIFSDMLIDNVT